jgi:hypothetical protein
MSKIQVLSLVFACVIAFAVADPFDYSALNYAVFEAHNKARTDPGYFANLAQDQLENQFVYDRNGNPTNSICLARDFIPKSNKCYYTLGTTEGPRAWKEAVQAMNNAPKGLQALQWSEGLAQACYDHISDTGPRGMIGHTGSDGSRPHQRIEKYVDASMTGENLAYSDAETGVDMVLQLIVDDGVPDRGHRTNILDGDFTHVGVSCGCHSYYTEMCCFAYGKDVKEKRTTKANVAPQLRQCKAYTPSTRGDTSGSFTVGEAPVPTPTAPAGAPQAPNRINNFDDLFPGMYNNNMRGTADWQTSTTFGDHSNVGSKEYNNHWGLGDWTYDFDNWFDSDWYKSNP